MQTASTYVLLSQDGATPPEWVQLVPAGTFRGVDGRGPWKLTDPAAVIAASLPPNDPTARLSIDENHAVDKAMVTGQPSPARGWIVELQAREDGIWGRVEWTPTGAQLMSEKAYRGISPVFSYERTTGAVSRIYRAALTNAPNLVELATLNAQQENGMDLTKLRQVLGLSETADEATIMATVTAHADAVAANGQQMRAIATAAGLAENLTGEGLVTALQAQRTNAGDASKLADQVIALQTQLTTLQNERGRERAVAFIDKAIAGGKPIMPLRDHLIARHMTDPTAVETEVNALPSINAGGTTVLNAAGGGGDDEPTEVERMTAEKMGVKPADLVAQRKRREATASDGRVA